MAPSWSTSSIRVLTSILLLLYIAHASVLPRHGDTVPHISDTIEARTPSQEAAITHDVDDVNVSPNEKKDGKTFFKELGSFLSGFDPVDIFRTILGGLMGFDDAADAAAKSGASPSPTTTVVIAATPIAKASVTVGLQVGASISVPLVISLPTVKTTVMKVLTTQVQKSSATSIKASVTTVPKGEIFSILPFFPSEEPLELTGLAPTRVFTPHHIIFTPDTSASLGVAVSTGADASVDVLPTFIETFPNIFGQRPTPFIISDDFEALATPLIDDIGAVETDGAAEPEETEDLTDLTAITASVNASTVLNATALIAVNATAPGITVTYEPEETFSILPFIEPGENLSDNVNFPDVPSPTDDAAITGSFEFPTAQVTAFDEATESSEPEAIFSILPFILPSGGLSDNVVLPATADEIPPSETFEVVTAPVTDVPGATLLPPESEETFSILPFLEPGEHLSDNVSEPTPTEKIPELPIPIFTGSQESLNPFQVEDIINATPDVDSPFQTDTADADDLAPVPLLEFVHGTYVLPTTKKPGFVTPLLSWPPPGFDVTAKPAISTRRGPPRKTSSRRIARPTKPAIPSLIIPRPTKSILLPPPLIRPTNFPLNQTFFANQTKGVSTPVVKPSRPLLLTNPLRPTIEPSIPPVAFPRPIIPVPLPRPIFNNTRGIRPLEQPTRPLILTDPLRPSVDPSIPPVAFPRPIAPVVFPRPFLNNTRGIRPTGRPLILTNPLRPTPESFPTLKAILNSTTLAQPTRPLILTNPLRPLIETFEPLDDGKTTTKTLKIRSTTIKTVIVIPTPVAEVPDVSILGVDVPADKPFPSDAGFVGPGFPFDGDDDFIKVNPRPTFPIFNDFDDFDVSSDVVTPTIAPIIDSFPEFDVPGDIVTATAVAFVGDVADLGIPSDLVEATTAPIIDDFATLNVSSSLSVPTPTPVEADFSLPVISLPLVDSLETPAASADIILDAGFGVEATPSVEAALDLPIEPTDLEIALPIFTPTPTPRTFATIPSVFPSPGKPNLALPSDFPLPKPAIDTTNVTFPLSAQHLAEICGDSKVATVTLPLLQKWYGPDAYPSLRPYPGCIPANSRQAIQAPGLLNCTALGKEVQTCQKAGKRVLLGIRVDAPAAVNGNLKWGSANPGGLGFKLPLQLPPGPFAGRPGHPLVPLAGNLTTVKVDGETVPAPNLFDALHTPTGLAATLFSLFGEGHAERADLRPLGPDAPSVFSPDKIKWVVKPLGEEVVVDGFDVRTPGQWKGTPQAALVDRFVGALRENVQKAWKESGGRKGGLNDLGVDGPGVVVSGYI